MWRAARSAALTTAQRCDIRNNRRWRTTVVWPTADAERREQIAHGLANAQQIKSELAQIEVQRRNVLAKADAEGRQLIEDARSAAARVHTVETAKAAAAAEQILQRAQAAAERERAQMLADLKRQIGRLVIQTSAAVTGKILTPEDQRRLAEETARQVPA